MDVGDRSYFRLGEDLRCLLLAVVNGNTFRDNLQFSGCALKVEIYIFRIEFCSGVTHRAEDSSPVGVMAEDCRFRQTRCDDGFCQCHGLLFALGSLNRHFEQCGCALAVACDVHRLCFIDFKECFFENLVILVFFRNFRVSGKTVCQKENGIVCGSITVYGNHVVGVRYDFAQCFLQHLFRNICIGCHKAQHGAHIRMDHAGALAHAADRYGFSADFDLNSNFLRLGVGCHDRLCCCSCGFSCSCKLRFQHFHAGCDLIDRNLFSDNTGRCNENGVLWNGKCSRCCLCGFSAVAIALLAGACIGDSAVADDCLCGWMVVYNLLVPFDRSCFYDVCSKGSCCYARYLAVDKCHILYALFFNSCCAACCLKTFCSSDASFNLFHSFILTFRKFRLLSASVFFTGTSAACTGLHFPAGRTSGSYSVPPVLLRL